MSQLHVGVDISSLVFNRGVSRYTANLVRALKKSPGLQLSLYGSSLRQKQVLETFVQEIKPTQSAIQSLPPSALSWLWSHTALNPVSKLLPNMDVFHSWDWIQPPDKNIPLVSTIHDVAMLHFPETAHPTVLARHQASWKVLRERQAQIIAVSRATKKDIVEKLEIPEERVTVVYEALPQELMKISQNLTDERLDQIVTQLNLQQPFIMAVGTREPRKNLERLIQAWLPLAKEYQLIIAGEAGWDESEKWQSKAKGQLRFLGKVSDQVLATLYSQAELLVYPSLYEGFGLPILEAFYHGTPVVTSAVSSLPEVAGNAAELVDPKSVESIRAGMTVILNETANEQQRRAQKMIVRLHMFDWQRVAKETINVYEKAVAMQGNYAHRN